MRGIERGYTKNKKLMNIAKMSLLSLALLFPLSGCVGNNASTTEAAQEGNTDAGYQKLDIKLSHVASDNTPKGLAALKFKEIVESESGGNIEVKVYPSGQLYGDNDEIEAVQANNVQIIIPSAAKLSGFEETFEIFDLPFMFKNEEHLRAFEDGEGGQQLLATLDEYGMKGLSFWPNGFKHITNNKVAVDEPSDVKGLKVRTHGGQIINEVYEAMGASSTKIAFNETYQALQLGTIDGQENSIVNIETQKYGEVQSNLTLTSHARSEYAVVTNKQWWDGLEPKTQELLTEAMKTATQEGRNQVEKLETEAIEKIKSEGKMAIVELTDEQKEAFKQAIQPVFDKWAQKMNQDIINKAIEAGN
ncbi:tripartite ATP-independent periplasmic transporter solute receptor, DctP family [Schinkia azotoformans MEV2011]|uniref:Tripartite ATP-independent periplasmic transporter solute receptor, DctP family n=1 Tax=Schinkia azotoformans MEV2011 TaxID=1348973 RepID=A0A072NK67_SCHAZ|nr:DctP family TRAP transporter solute-binding subunit [Schinkia azotoformans]KEF37871.1 tripartite ATP-independent periplasmic transporter solute receptor, DctP family [Schinkia azotoformans MEV2011]MEC1696553.1 DctP family TRAP transporter solute-binding subunit [Schinkia azotoformans]MEC1725956.1 DctP family TRAP transporter solute-binding subunit [Schinkia azotoformans]MEC1745761.1 DctP family TRAP transporter solute-binding subunit [Schinkia azotoformans]MEC1770097.1 DctP family TRAP tran